MMQSIDKMGRNVTIDNFSIQPASLTTYIPITERQLLVLTGKQTPVFSTISGYKKDRKAQHNLFGFSTNANKINIHYAYRS